MLLSKAALLSKNGIKREVIIKELQMLGITNHNGRDVQSLDYYEAKNALTIELIKRG